MRLFTKTLTHSLTNPRRCTGINKQVIHPPMVAMVARAKFLSAGEQQQPQKGP